MGVRRSWTWVVAGLALALVGQAQPATQRGKWQVVREKDFGIVVPTGWRNFPRPMGTMRLHLTGDGVLVPIVDETGAPLQLGLTVEKFANSKETLQEGIDALTKTAKAQPALTLVGKESVEAVTLKDGTMAMVLTTEFLKERTRHSLYLKMVAKDAAGNGFVVTGFLVGGRESKWPTKESRMAQWVRAMVESFVLDGEKAEAGPVEASYGRLLASTRPAK
jgi:hypothetical protein